MQDLNSPQSLPAKLLPPNVKGALPRERLFGVLDSIRQSHRMIWLHAPPGAGKTTLAGGYAQRFSIPPLWYRFDEGDRDPGPRSFRIFSMRPALVSVLSLCCRFSAQVTWPNSKPTRANFFGPCCIMTARLA
ncbi:MAG: hypothetical protein KJ725_13700 [Gammaproteobacteria bacterium]|nr:hypothetical protein [Gammaproteobacteria bacterium]